MIQYIYRGTTKVLGYTWDILKWLWQNVCQGIRCICWPVQKIWQVGVWCINWVWQKIANWLWPGSHIYVDCQILDKRWKDELQRYRSIYLKPACECHSICQAIHNHLPDIICQTEDEAVMTVIVTKKTTRVQSDAESAIERINHQQDHRNRTILLMFHRVMGSKSVEDVTSIMYTLKDTSNATLTFLSIKTEPSC